jgi:hypothetical protein
LVNMILSALVRVNPRPISKKKYDKH